MSVNAALTLAVLWFHYANAVYFIPGGAMGLERHLDATTQVSPRAESLNQLFERNPRIPNTAGDAANSAVPAARINGDSIDFGAKLSNQGDAHGQRCKPPDQPPPADHEKVHQLEDQARAQTKGWEPTDAPSQDQLNKKIGDNNFLYWGDAHAVDSEARFKNALPGLKNAGVNTIAIEGIGQDKQELVNKFVAATPGTQEEQKLKDEIKQYLTDTGPKDPNCNPVQEWIDKTMAVLHDAKDQGLKVLAPEPIGYPQSTNRDANWNNVIQQDRKANTNPNSKLLIFAGSGHFVRGLAPTGAIPNENIADIFQRQGVKAVDLTPPSLIPTQY
ncbi:MAG TPA: hypothetical protein V6D22_06710 [Candidatus Obscuribacterales bacterium]